MPVETLLVALGVGVSVLVAILVAAELWLRAMVFDPGRHYPRKPGSWGVFRPSPDGTPGVTADAHVTINRHGLRGDRLRFRAKPRVLVVGGSTTEDNFLNDADSWVGQLQARLRTRHPRGWAGNMGRSGATALHHALQLERMLVQLPAIDTVVVLCGLNDMLYDSGLHLSPAYKPPRWEMRMAFGHLPTHDAGWLERSALRHVYDMLLEKLRYRLRGAAPDLPVFDMGAAIAAFKARRRRVQPEDWITAPPALDGALARYRATLIALIETCRGHEVDLVLATQPYIWDAVMTDAQRTRLYAGGLNDVGDWFADPHNRWYTVEALRVMLGAYNDVMRAVCAAHDVPCIDLEAALPKDAENFCDDFHFSCAGAAAVADHVFAGLQAAGLPRERTRNPARGPHAVPATRDLIARHDAALAAMADERAALQRALPAQRDAAAAARAALAAIRVAATRLYWREAGAAAPTLEFRVANDGPLTVTGVVADIAVEPTGDTEPLPAVRLLLPVSAGPGATLHLRAALPAAEAWRDPAVACSGDLPARLTLVDVKDAHGVALVEPAEQAVRVAEARIAALDAGIKAGTEDLVAVRAGLPAFAPPFAAHEA